MARTSAAKTALPAPARRALKTLGADVAVARKRRRIPQQLLADRMLVSRQTVQRLEAGDPTVSLGVLASAFFILGFTSRLEALLSPQSDAMGMSEELARLPKRIHTPVADDLDF
ncbi:helix-turn-helix transcriptional regulator [Caulobacter segnis]|uniref:helix-turn-helix domain-containing protein n=1 Tax=Caulobacter segnis TaxID=88688 RepID=UPI00240F57B1|nr:helix-turn-helix transcriptional regulator [Caulobacter segnis]MDG2520444.1 helix-turn-helix transcriptional regulator [Caulobacter segnis]